MADAGPLCYCAVAFVQENYKKWLTNREKYGILPIEL